MTSELRAFRYHRKNINSFLDELSPFWGNDEKLAELYKTIADKFGADYKKLMEINQISYERSVERAFR